MATPQLVAQDANPDREALFYQYYPMVKSIARKWASRMPPSVEIDDLIAIGCIGLMNAIERYEPARAESFSAYVRMRIQGEILDDLRSEDVVPRTVREMSARITRATHEIMASTGQAPSSSEIAEHLGVSLKRFREIRYSLARGSIISLDGMGAREDGRGVHDILEDVSAVDACNALERQEFQGQVQEAISQLRPRYKDVIHLYYVEEMTMKEIGEILGVSEARICQIHKSAVSALRKRLKTVVPPPTPA